VGHTGARSWWVQSPAGLLLSYFFATLISKEQEVFAPRKTDGLQAPPWASPHGSRSAGLETGSPSSSYHELVAQKVLRQLWLVDAESFDIVPQVQWQSWDWRDCTVVTQPSQIPAVGEVRPHLASQAKQ